MSSSMLRYAKRENAAFAKYLRKIEKVNLQEEIIRWKEIEN